MVIVSRPASDPSADRSIVWLCLSRLASDHLSQMFQYCNFLSILPRLCRVCRL